MTRTRSVLILLLLLGVLAVSTTSARAEQHRPGRVVLMIVDGPSFEDLLSVPQVAALARQGGAGLVATSERYRANPAKVFQAMGSGADPESGQHALLARTLCAHGVAATYFKHLAGLSRPYEGAAIIPPPTDGCRGLEPGSRRDVFLMDWILTADEWDTAVATGHRMELLQRIGHDVREGTLLLGQSGLPSLAIVVSPTASGEMTRRGDEVTPIVMAANPRFLPPGNALTSDTTREPGLVASVDVAPTILAFFGIEAPKEMTGQPIRVDGTVDLEHLHQLHLEQRRIRLPIQLGEVAFVSALGIVGIAALLWFGVRGVLPLWASHGLRFLALCGAALPIPLMAGGLLPRLTYWVVVPFLVLSVSGLAALALAARWRGPMGPFVFLGVVGLAFVVLDALFGWRAARIPLLGGTMFDGVRFYGLPNSFIALLLASAVFVAVVLHPFSGSLLLVAAGLFAGFPNLGANVGGAVTLFAGAGMWWVIRTRRRFGWREIAFVAGVVAVGLAAVLLANRYLPGAPTHITGFVERTGGVAGAWHAVLRRLGVGFRQIAGVPPAVIPLIGLAAVLVLALVPRGPVRAGLDQAGGVWRQALIVVTVAGIAAFFANDTGVAAAAPVFLYAMTALAYPAYLAAERAAS